jgi:hypothetical protein
MVGREANPDREVAIVAAEHVSAMASQLVASHAVELQKITASFAASINASVARSISESLRPSWAAMARTLAEQLDTTAIASAILNQATVERIQEQATRNLLQALAPIQQAMPALIGSYARLISAFDQAAIDSVARSDAMRRAVESVGKVKLTAIDVDWNFVSSLREAEDGSQEVGEGSESAELLDDLREIEDAAKHGVRSRDGSAGAILFLTALMALMEFLAKQDTILEKGFEDLANLGQVLTSHWPYVVVLLAALLFYDRGRG